MDPDRYQQAWQAHASATRITVDADLLRQKVQRNQQLFRATIFWRDFREVVVAVLLIPAWFYLGARSSSPWTWYLTVPVLVWMAGFMLVYRQRHHQTPSQPGEPLLQFVERSVQDVEAQIWLLRNVFWWYLLPPGISISAYFAHVAWSTSDNTLAALAGGGILITCLAALYYGIYRLNQLAVRTQLEPRRQELLTLLSSLQDETNPHEESAMNSAATRNRPKELGRTVAIIVALTLVTAVASVAADFAGRAAADYPKTSPFAAVRWQESQPEVKVGEEWFTLVSIDGIAAEEIVAFSRKTYKTLWQKRFEEDLVEVLAGMGHETGDKVRLVVRPLGSTETRTLEDIPLTEANRKAIREAAQARQRAEIPLADLIPALRKEKKLVGLAAMVMVDGNVVFSGVDGERKSGSKVPLQIGDRWHLGSITKSITATMIARLVESGQMNWSDTLGETFPDAPLHDDWKPVTLQQLLTHTAGAPTNFSLHVRRQQPPLGPEATQARRDAIAPILAEKPIHPPGKTFAYSNVGYSIAGAMAEHVTGKTWDDLVTREVYEPLKLAGAGFGPPKSPEKTLDQPRGHRTTLGWKSAVNDDDDNTPIMAPAGLAHMTLHDLCTYAHEHLRGDAGAGQLLSAETYRLLHTPHLDRYAFGWLKNDPADDLPHVVYWHNGSNTMWYALVVFIPDLQMVVAVTSNDGDIARAESAAWDIVRGGVAQFGVQPRDPPPAASPNP